MREGERKGKPKNRPPVPYSKTEPVPTPRGKRDPSYGTANYVHYGLDFLKSGAAHGLSAF